MRRLLTTLVPTALIGLVATLLLAAPPARASAAQGLTLRSADGSHVARLEQLVDDPRPARRTLWQLTVYEDRGPRGEHRLWSLIGPEPDPDSTYLVADDGSAVCRVLPFYDPRPETGDPEATLVEVFRRGRRSGTFDAEALEVVLDETALRARRPRWIEPAADTARIRSVRFGTSSTRAVLDLLASDGGLRTIDLSNNNVVVSADASRTGISIVPAAPTDVEAKLERVFVRSWTAPAEVPGNLGFAVRVRGAFPTAGWRVLGFGVELREEEAEAPLIVITPYAARLNSGGAAQVITHFDSTCTVAVPRPGSYRLEVHGREDPELTQPLEVLPTALFVSLLTSGGIAGIEREVVVHRDGRLAVDGRVSLLDTRAFTELVSLVRALPAEGVVERSPGNDFFQYDLAWVPDRRVARATFDDGSLVTPWREVVERLTELAAPKDTAPPERAAYRLVPGESELLIRTGTAGLLKPLGHKHTIRVPEFKGEVIARPGALEEGTLVLIADATALGVVEDDENKGTIDKNMHADVLDSANHTQVVFRSTRVEAKELSEGRYEAVIDGDLALRGVTRLVRLSALIEFTGDGVRARGKGSFKLSHFGIKAPKALGGTINVADRVELRFDVRAR